MTRNVEVIGSNAPLVETAAKMKNLDVGLIPVCEVDELKGTPTDRDITVRRSRKHGRAGPEHDEEVTHARETNGGESQKSQAKRKIREHASRRVRS
jgi:hypothetical protein